MKNLKYLIQYFLIVLMFSLFKLIGHKYSLIISSKIIFLIGPLFRSNKLVYSNLNNAFPNLSGTEKKKIAKALESDLRKAFKETDKKKDLVQFLKLKLNVKRCLKMMKKSQKIRQLLN